MSIVYNLERYQKIFEQAVTPIYLFDPETKHLNEANTAFMDLLGYSAEEIKTLTLYDFILQKKESIDKNIQYLLKTGAITIGERLWRRKDETLIDVLVTAGKMRLEEKDTCFVMAHDINERKQIEKELKKSKELLESITQGITEKILLLSKDFKILWANKIALEKTGYGEREILGNYCYKVINHREDPCDPHFISCPILALQKTGKSVSVDCCFDKNGVVIESIVYPIKDGTGDIVQFIHVSKDITEQRNAERKLNEAKCLLESFSRSLLIKLENERRHLARELHDEIGQLLTSLKINLQNMQLILSSQKYKNSLNETIANVDHLFEKVHDLSIDLRPSILDDLGLVPAIRWYVYRIKKECAFTIEFIADLDYRLQSIEIELICFRLVQECLTNIIRHAKAQQVTIELRHHEKELKLIVSDDGVGFDVKSAQRLAMAGECLGLLGMQERVTLIGGSIEIESVQGRGTKIKACFPLK